MNASDLQQSATVGSNLTCTRLKQKLTMSTNTDIPTEKTTILIIHKLRTGLMTDLSLSLSAHPPIHVIAIEGPIPFTLIHTSIQNDRVDDDSLCHFSF